MLPSIVKRRIEHANAVAASLRDKAGACTSQQPALRETLLTGAQALDDLVEAVEMQTEVAKMNHDTILKREAP